MKINLIDFLTKIQLSVLNRFSKPQIIRKIKLFGQDQKTVFIMLNQGTQRLSMII